jgi:hypothetical protein
MGRSGRGGSPASALGMASMRIAARVFKESALRAIVKIQERANE